MTHFGVICPALPSHLATLGSLGRELQRRGHRVTFLQIADVEPRVCSEGMEYFQVGKSFWPVGTFGEAVAQLGYLSGLAALKHTIEIYGKTTASYCTDAPSAIKLLGIDALICDQTEPCGSSVAKRADVPMITVCCALALNRDAAVPPFYTNWDYQQTPWHRVRNEFGFWLFRQLGAPVRKILNEYRSQWSLLPVDAIDDCWSDLAQICQQPAEFDFPKEELPECFHYVGPLRTSSPHAVEFPYEKLDQRPLVYASLGTLQNRLGSALQTIAKACADLDVQLVLSLGGGDQPENYKGLPGNPIVVGYAPQIELLERAKLVITHAGLNTALECLNHGVPMVAIPITNDQPGVAARIQWAGAGESIPVGELNVEKLKAAVTKVLLTRSYAMSAMCLKNAIQKAGGAGKAADIIESVCVSKERLLPITRN
jgi:zeaxanthin glucosyltransferase